MDCITVKFLVIILYISEARCYRWGKLGEEYMRPLHYFLKLHVNLKLPLNKKLKNTQVRGYAWTDFFFQDHHCHDTGKGMHLGKQMFQAESTMLAIGGGMRKSQK